MTPLLALLFQLQLPAPVGFVNDFAHVVQPADSAAMAGIIQDVKAKSGGEIVVVTLADIGGRAAIDVARDIGRQWKVGAQAAAGDPRRNTGVVLLLVPGRRPGDGKSEVAVATGTGAEGFITDMYAGQVRDAIGRAAVEGGSFGAGLVAGVQMLGQAYAREFNFQLTGAPPAEQEQPQQQRQHFPWLPLALIVLALLLRARRGGGGSGGLLSALIWSSVLGGGRRGGGWGGGGWGGGGGFGGFGGGGGFSGGGASGKF